MGWNRVGAEVFKRPVPCLIERDLLRMETAWFLSGSGLEIRTLERAHELVRFPADSGAELVFSKVVSVGDPDGPGFIGTPANVGKRLDGEWVGDEP